MRSRRRCARPPPRRGSPARRARSAVPANTARSAKRSVTGGHTMMSPPQSPAAAWSASAPARASPSPCKPFIFQFATRSGRRGGDSGAMGACVGCGQSCPGPYARARATGGPPCSITARDRGPVAPSWQANGDGLRGHKPNDRLRVARRTRPLLLSAATPVPERPGRVFTIRQVPQCCNPCARPPSRGRPAASSSSWR